MRKGWKRGNCCCALLSRLIAVNVTKLQSRLFSLPHPWRLLSRLLFYQCGCLSRIPGEIFRIGILEERNAWDKGSWFQNARGNPFQHSRDGLRRGNGAISMSPSSYSYHQEIFESCGTLASLLGTFHVSRCKNVTCSSILFQFRHTTLHHFSFILPSYFLSLSFGVPFMNDITFRRSLVDVRIIRQ